MLLLWWDGREGWKGGRGGDEDWMGADEIKNDDDDDDNGGGDGWLLLLSFTWSECLHVPIDRCDVVAGEHARLAVAASFPPVGVRVVQDLDEVTASETQLSFLLGVKVKERLHVCGMLWNERRERRKYWGGNTDEHCH